MIRHQPLCRNNRINIKTACLPLRTSNYELRTHRTGSVMIEFVMIIGLLATILASVFFFGWAMGNQHNAKVAARYQSWRQARRAVTMDAAQINEYFLQSRAKDSGTNPGVQQHWWRTAFETRDAYIKAVGEYNTRAQTAADDAIYNNFAGVSAVEFEILFPYEGGIYSKLEGPLFSGHVREGPEWYIEAANNLPPICNEFYPELDAALSNLSDQNLSDDLRELYLTRFWRGWQVDY